MFASVLFNLMSRPDGFQAIDTKTLEPLIPDDLGTVTIDTMKKGMDMVARSDR